jgi:hypothetical protein
MCNKKISSIIHDIELLDEDECNRVVDSFGELFSELAQITKEACNEIERICFVNKQRW